MNGNKAENKPSSENDTAPSAPVYDVTLSLNAEQMAAYDALLVSAGNYRIQQLTQYNTLLKRTVWFLAFIVAVNMAVNGYRVYENTNTEPHVCVQEGEG